MTKFFYDTEFLDNGVTIDLISIGIVREDGETYYAVSQDADWVKIRRHPWLSQNVVPHLPPEMAWKSRGVIRAQVRRFLQTTPPGEQPSRTELWAWFAAYDHVALSQLFGRMLDLPPGLPMYTHDLRSLVDWTGCPNLPAQDPASQHDALADARWVKAAHEHVMRHILAKGAARA